MIQCSLQPASLALSVLSETRSIRSVDRLTFPIEMKGWQSLIDSFLEKVRAIGHSRNEQSKLKFHRFSLPNNLKHPSQQEKHKQVFITRKGREVKAKTTKPVAEPPPFWLKRTHQRNPQQEALHPKELLKLASPGRVPRSEERRGEAFLELTRREKTEDSGLFFPASVEVGKSGSIRRKRRHLSLNGSRPSSFIGRNVKVGAAKRPDPLEVRIVALHRQFRIDVESLFKELESTRYSGPGSLLHTYCTQDKIYLSSSLPFTFK
ncbi:hypothetical protein IGI04_019976 [Brassica rapa subsp. trilocularis]|uniref:TPX2 central domain-containing protein n=1 Tax=Brassica rapa subsp. trilocularis TaxID=1813537 RepID=A0ABQ7MHE7_BRACM|nr:hypothetical protein IGI04_019976 [Brassica rapa subsp. trilocularis]